MDFDIHKSIQVFLKCMKQSYESNKLYKIVLTYETNIQNKELQKHLYNNSFVGESVKKGIETTQLIYTEITYKHHNIYLYVPIHNKPPNIKLICMIINFYELLGEYYNNKIKNVNLVVIYSNAKKTIQYNTKILTHEHINSGATYPGEIIICFRKEEFYKVFIHELFHYYKFDFYRSDIYYDGLINILNVPRIKGNDYINESYTETCALIIYTIMKYFIHKINTNFNKFFKDVINEEINFTIGQIAKTGYIIYKQPEESIYRQIYNYVEPKKEYIINKKSYQKLSNILMKAILLNIFDGKIVIQQTTSWRSYFLIKLVLIFNIHKLLNFIDININVQNERLLEFGELINESIKYFRDNIPEFEYTNNMSMCMTNKC